MQKIIFCTGYEYFKYFVMFFKLTNSSILFMELKNDIFCLYLDLSLIMLINDILVYNKILVEHKNY